ncbi:50S ribosomal protein L24 [Candidatus Karelsulcia muelleri]|uniref:50S ribosomal protein L24 n=1 Tax=Candidatus Karelsulcia muelleri TaxID=336810 RepID=UPI0035C8B089
MKIKIKKGDYVMILTGKNKTKKGIIKKIIPKLNKAIVNNINFIKKHVKPINIISKGKILEKEAPIHISNIYLLNKNNIKKK